MLLLSLQASTFRARVLPTDSGQAPPARWCHMGGTGGPKRYVGRAQMTQWDRQGVSDGRCEPSREQVPLLEEAARHQGLQEDPLLKLDCCLCGELQLSLRFSCGWQDDELWAGTWFLVATEVSFCPCGQPSSSLAGGVGLWNPSSFQAQETPEAPWPSTFTL